MVNPLNTNDQQFLNTLNRINERLAKAQQQAASGKKLVSVSDEPDQVGNLLQARAELSRVTQVKTNLGMWKLEADTAEQSISDTLTAIERARVLASQGLTGTQTASSRQAIATELEGIIQRVVTATRVAVNGRYLFSGDSDSVVPYVYSAGPPPSVSAYAGSASTRVATDANGQSFSLGIAGNAVFQSTFNHLIALHTALVANDEAGISAAWNDLGSETTRLNQVLASYGAIQNRIGNALDTASKSILSLNTQIGQAEDADMTEAILEMNRAALQQNAALSSRARLPQRSLFDYLS